MMKTKMFTKATVSMLSLAALSAACAPDASEPTTTAALSFEEQNQLVSNYCMGCHNFDEFAGGLELLLFDSETAHEDAELAEKIIRKIRAGQMPPRGEPRPDFETYMAFAESLETQIDANAEYHPGWRGLHRMNRAEYANAIRDLLALDVDSSAFLPVDDSSNGFDNQAGALGLSPVLLQAYLAAAGDISRLAVGDVSSPSQTMYRLPEDESQNSHVEGLPFGTRGGVLIDHTFPADGDYNLKIFPVTLGNMGNDRPFGEMRGEQLEVLLDGERVALFDWDEEFGVGAPFGEREREGVPTIDLVIPVTAGPHQVGVTFLASNYAPGLDLNNAFERSRIETGGLPGFTFYPHVGGVRVDGPYNPAGVTDSPSRRAIFSCMPESEAEEAACASEIIERFARRAFRGQVTDADIATLNAFYEDARSVGDFEDGIQAALQRTLADPKFVYRVETPPESVDSGEDYRISDLELASRLSFFLWSSIPDDELLTVAEQGRLSEPEVLDAQVRRMLEDPKSRALTENFAGQWLALRNLDGHVPVVDQFPDFDDNLRGAMRTEVELFFDSLIRDDRPARELLTADYTFVNERLADHYGIPGVKGSRFRRVELGDEFDERHGILGKGSVLTVSSQPVRTSPVIRGNWVLSNVLGAPAPPPPPDVPEIEPPDPNSDHIPSLREQMEMHRADPVCMGCHSMMDPIGFALEPFDATGRARTVDAANNPINASDELYDGTPVNGPLDLREFVLRYENRFLTNVADKMLTYAVGRGMEYDDMPLVRSVVRDAEADDYRFHSLISAVVASDAFQMNTAPDAEQTASVETDAETDPGR